MRCPSVETLTKNFRDLDRKQALLIRRIAKAKDDKAMLQTLIEKHCPKTDRWARSCYSNPFENNTWRITMTLAAIDEIVGTFGVEGLGGVRDLNPPKYDYLNTGDLYDLTLIYKRDTDNLYFGSPGAIIESMGSPRE